MSEAYEPKIVTLPGATLSPETTLHRTLDKLPRIKAVVIAIQWDDGSWDCDWSSMKVSDLCMSGYVLDRSIQETIGGVNIGPEPRSAPSA